MAALRLELARHFERDVTEVGFVLLLGPVTRTCHRQRERTLWCDQAQVQHGKTAHGQADHMGAVHPCTVHDRQNVGGRGALRIGSHLRGHVRGRVTPRRVGDAAMAARKVPHLRLPAAVVTPKLMHEHDGRAAAGLLEVQLHAVGGGGKGHGGLLLRD